MEKYYAVKNGRKIGVFKTWDECKIQVDGYSGAIYKSFQNIDDAKKFITGEENTEESKNFAYVDGSFLADTNEFSFGAIISVDGEVFEFSKKFSDPDMATMRNVAGEIVGSGFVMRYALQNNLKSIDIYYDYAGIEKWCTGEWKANKDGTIRYRDFYLSIKDKLKINFIKVKGHSGNKLNDRADRLAKDALGIE